MSPPMRTGQPPSKSMVTSSVTTSIVVESSTDVWALARPLALARALSCVVDNAVRADFALLFGRQVNRAF